MGRKLVIGASGQIGAELIDKLADKYGDDQVIATDIKPRNSEQLNGVISLQMDVLDREHLLSVIKAHEITEVYLLAALLSAISEQKIHSAWELNINGLFNVLELAREGHIKRIFWPSSIAVFGQTSPKDGTPQSTILEPLTVYGISKLAGERWCEYYFKNFNVDVRSLRYPGIISHKSKPGGGTTDYAVDIFYEAVNKCAYESFVEQDVKLPMMFMDDAIRAIIELMEADRDKLTINSSYNVSAMSFSPKELAEAIQIHLPEFKITYQPDFRNNIALSWPSSIDDTKARQDWGWSHEYDINEMTTVMLNALTKKIKINQ